MAITRAPGNRRRTKIIAAASAAAVVLGVGATYTLASWNDSEWVWGGAANGDPGLGTSTFEVVQNTTSPYADVAVNWVNEETNSGGALQFTANALTLTPGDTTYAPVALRTVEDSLGASVSLQGAVAAAGTPTAPTNDTELFDAVRVTVYTAAGATAPSACDATFTAAGWTAVVSDQTLDTAATAPQTLTADAGSTQHYCFAITLPASTPDVDDLQGRQISPAWVFDSESV